jgi:hypothetical protein
MWVVGQLRLGWTCGEVHAGGRGQKCNSGGGNPPFSQSRSGANRPRNFRIALKPYQIGPDFGGMLVSQFAIGLQAL